MARLLLCCSLLLLYVSSGAAVVTPNTSLATVPVAYFGGNAAHRNEANIDMLSKMRIVMIEKWEGHCWQDCFANSSSPACQPSCGAENDILDTMRRVKQKNPSTSTVLYLAQTSF